MPIHFSPKEMAGRRERAAAATRDAGVFLTNALTGVKPPAMRNTTSVRLDAHKVRDALLARGGPNGTDFVRCAYRPFDHR